MHYGQHILGGNNVNMPPQQPFQQVYQQPQPIFQQIYPQQQVANKGMKTAAIVLFVQGFCLKLIGFLLLAIFIGIIPLVMGAGCDVMGFVFLCLI